MLILSRKKSETIEINGGFAKGGITIMVFSIRGDKVRIGIDAPPDVPINRGDIQKLIDAKSEPVEVDEAATAKYRVFCPHCYAPYAVRERRINGNDTCGNGHVYPSIDAVMLTTSDSATA